MMLAKIVLLVSSGVTFVWTLVQPINSGLIRGILLLAMAVFLLALLSLVWKRNLVRYSFIILILCLMTFIAMPTRSFDRNQVLARYKVELSNYEHSPYVWGGENRNGIDCSGLPRAAFRKALFKQGVWTLNGGLVRESALQWWFDASAQALAGGYRSYMVALPTEGTIREVDYSGLQTGDVAITKSGIHCLVYFEDNTWIQADPGDGSVAFYDGRTSDNSWMKAPMGIHRWRKLQ